MSGTQVLPIGLRFGAELEVVTGSRSNAHTDWNHTANELSKELERKGIRNHVNHSHDKDEEDYSEWSIIQEGTVTSHPKTNRWAIELVSPILDFQHHLWNQHMDDVWWVLQEKFDTSTNTQCSTHVHISPAQRQWTLDHIKRVAKAALYFERSVDTVLPPERRCTIWAHSNRNNISLRHQDMDLLFSWIDGAQDVAQIVSLVCLYPKDTMQGLRMGKSHDFPHRVFRWNFTPLTKHSMGTIEFRQPPGSSDAASTKLWVTFAVSFVQAAITSAHTLNSARLPVLEDFKAFLLNGAVQSGVTDSSMLDRLFHGKTQLPPGEYNLHQLTQQGLDNLGTKAAELNTTLENFKELYGYK